MEPTRRGNLTRPEWRAPGPPRRSSSTSSTRSLRSNRRAMQALWIFILRLPTPSAPNAVTPSRSTPSSVSSIPSTPAGGTAFKSAATRSPARCAQAGPGTRQRPAAPALSRSSEPSSTLTACEASAIVTARTAPPNRCRMPSTTCPAASECLEVMETSEPAWASRTGGAYAHRARAGCNHRTQALHGAGWVGGVPQLCHGGDGCGVRAARIEHDRRPHRAEECLTDGHQETLALSHVGPTDEDSRMVQVLRPACEDRAVHEVTDFVHGDAAVAHHLVRAGVQSDDAVEDTRVGRAVEMQEQVAHGAVRRSCGGVASCLASIRSSFRRCSQRGASWSSRQQSRRQRSADRPRRAESTPWSPGNCSRRSSDRPWLPSG